MHKLLAELITGIEFTGDIQTDSLKLLLAHRCDEVASHSAKVANEAKRIATNYGVNEEFAFFAGLLHDIGNVIPTLKRVGFCNELGIEVLDEERLAPSLLHQKLSKVIARDVFHMDTEICNAIECHSTLKANASKLDLILFIADKVSWDRIYNEAFIEEMLEGLNVSLECSATRYLKHLLNGQAGVSHPHAVEAYRYFRSAGK